MDALFLVTALGVFSLMLGVHVTAVEEELADEDFTPEDHDEVTVYIANNKSDFMSDTMPEEVVLALSGQGNPELKVTVFKRPGQQQVPVYTFDEDGQPPSQVTYSDRSKDTEEITWYATEPAQNVGILLGVKRTWSEVHEAFQVIPVNISLFMVDGNAFALEPLEEKKEKRSVVEPDDLMQGRKYRMVRTIPFFGSLLSIIRRTETPQCKEEVYIDVCVHVDYDLFFKKNINLGQVYTFVMGLLSEVQIVYHNLSRSDAFPYHININLAKLFVEQHLVTDPIRLRTTPLTQVLINGRVYQDLVKSHDLLTAWLTDYPQPGCDHYALLTGTTSSVFIEEGDVWQVYPSSRKGLAWNEALCSHGNGQFSSVIHDVGQNTFIVMAHELGHSFGLYHDQDMSGCETKQGFVMDKSMRRGMTPTGAQWSDCSVRDMAYLVSNWNNHAPGCLEQQPSTLDELCRNSLGPDVSFDEASLQGDMATICYNGLPCKSASDGRVRLGNVYPGTPCGQEKECNSAGACADRPRYRYYCV